MPKGIYQHKKGYKRPPRSKEWSDKISASNLGKKKSFRTKEHKEKIRARMLGWKPTPERLKRMSEVMSGDKNPNYGKFGPKAPNWKGGRTKLNKIIRESGRYYEWRASVYKRDNYTCQFCSKHCDDLNADHIKPFALILLENEIKSLEEALKCKELWNIDNGRTLCHECHRKTITYGKNIFYII
jgi:hypothetical protein